MQCDAEMGCELVMIESDNAYAEKIQLVMIAMGFREYCGRAREEFVRLRGDAGIKRELYVLWKKKKKSQFTSAMKIWAYTYLRPCQDFRATNTIGDYIIPAATLAAFDGGGSRKRSFIVGFQDLGSILACDAMESVIVIRLFLFFRSLWLCIRCRTLCRSSGSDRKRCRGRGNVNVNVHVHNRGRDHVQSRHKF